MCSPKERLKKSHVWCSIPEAHWCTNPVPLFGCHHVVVAMVIMAAPRAEGEGGREEGMG